MKLVKLVFIIQVMYLFLNGTSAYSVFQRVCGRTKKSESLQIVFVMDTTKSFSKFNQEFQKGFPDLAQEILKHFPKTEFGLTAFADYPKSAAPDIGETDIPGKSSEEGEPHEVAEACYTRVRPLSANYADIPKSLAATAILANGGRENSLGALTMAVVDKNMGWDQQSNDTSTVRKVVVLMTERTYGNITKPGDRHRFIGDGSDTCSSSWPPMESHLTQILYLKNVWVILVIPTGQYEVKRDYESVYGWYFGAVKRGTRVCGDTFNLQTELSSKKIVEVISSCIKELC